jgi:hypothetical protein
LLGTRSAATQRVSALLQNNCSAAVTNVPPIQRARWICLAKRWLCFLPS